MKSLALLLFLASTALSVDFQCRDQNNKEVDWFVFYKIPTIKESENPIIKDGVGFMYFDSNNKQWNLSNVGIDSKQQALAYTLQQYYDNVNDPEVFSLMYSDQLPYPQNGTWSRYSGHSKGFTMFGPSKGFWVSHTIPKFARNDTYEYPSNAHRYGQMGICISLHSSALLDIAKQLFMMRLFIYSSSLPTSLAANNTLLAMVVSGRYQMDRPFANVAHLTTTGNSPFIHFAKAGQFGKDLYFDLLAPTLQVSLMTETWQHRSGTSDNLHSWCYPPNPYHVFDVKSLKLPNNITFVNYNDHSKFAVSTDNQGRPAYPWVCIGDINRQTHQLSRGGGSLCSSDPQLYAAFYGVVTDYWPCEPDHF